VIGCFLVSGMSQYLGLVSDLISMGDGDGDMELVFFMLSWRLGWRVG